MYRKILVPLDGSSFGEQALPLAISLAKRSGADLQLVHAHRPLEATYAELQIFDETLEAELRGKEQEYLNIMQKRVQPLLDTKVGITFLEGDVSRVLCESTKALGADLMVATTHARGPFARFWLGSVADELARSVPIPLILVHPSDRPPPLGADVVFQHILVALDGTPLSEMILSPSLELAKAMRADLTLLRVVRPVLPVTLVSEPGMFGDVATHMVQRIEEAQASVRDEATQYLEKTAAPLRAQGLEVKTLVSVEDQPAAAILEQAKGNIDLIALETHGRRGLSRIFLGSVADKVVRSSQLPVLIHHPVV